MSAQETLFSLELVIDCVRFDGSRGNVLVPAVGVRFLDFPTLLIYQSGQEDVSSKPGCADLCPSPEALSQKYPFHKGKSCLFKMSLDSLHVHLLNTPLYAMVLDVKDETPRFIGSSLISLAKVMERIQLDVGKRGIGTPSAHGERLFTPICNLMGSSIGAISLVYKIVSLGANLIPHIPDSSVYEVALTRGEGEQHKSVCAKCENVVHTEKDEVPPKVCEDQMSLDGRSADVVVVSEAKQPGLPAVTQTEQSIPWSEEALEHTTFCPPPLFYSSGMKSQQERKSFTGFHAAMESLNLEDPEDGNNESSVNHEFPEITAGQADRSRKLTSTPKSAHEETDSAPLGNVIRQLPLLNALLVELSQIHGQMPQQPLSIHPNLAWLYTSAQNPPAPEEQKTIKASPEKRPGQCKRKSAKSASGAKKNEPKRTLKYGLTKTFRLRLKMVKPGLTKRHECIEDQNIKQDQPMRPDRKHVRKAVYRGETIETLVSSFEMDPTATKHVASFTETTLTERDKKVRVHIPSDRSEQISDPGVQRFKESIREGSRASSRPLTRNDSFEQEEYQDDFTSLNTTDGYSPDPLSSPETHRRKTHSSASSASGQNKALPVPVKAEKSPQRSLKATHVIRPRLQTSALSLSSDDSEDEFQSSGSGRHARPGSQSSGPNAPSVCGTSRTSQSLDSDSGDKGLTQDSDNNPVLKPVSDAEEERDKLGSLGLDRNCHHISELVFNKLPGYTL